MLELRYVPLSWAAQRFLIGNVKKHDIGAIYESIKKYGFRDPLGHDKNLNNGQGGIIEGNGRLECLTYLHKENPDSPPQGVKKECDEWLIPVLFGCDADSEPEAVAYSLDHNLTMLRGGDRSVYDILAKDFDPGVFDAIRDVFDSDFTLAGMDGDDLDNALDLLTEEQERKLEFEEHPEEDEAANKQHSGRYPLALALDKETWEDWQSFKAQIGVSNDVAAFTQAMIRLVDISHA